jgi:hypothetical protein
MKGSISLRETTFKKIIKKHEVPLFVVSQLLGYTYSYTSHLLAGHVKMPESAAKKLEAFCKKLEDSI